MPSKAYVRLQEFLEHHMRMSHIYQPVMIRRILKGGGSASLEEIAAALMVYDRSQLEYYMVRTKNMVGRVLTNNGIVQPIKSGREIQAYQLAENAGLQDAEIQDLIRICDQKIDTFIGKRGDKIWSHRSKSSGYIPGTLRYEVLKRAHFRCELCGISADQKALEVDHILPRNKGGGDEAINLQALCYSCNAMKRDRDDTDFRGMAKSYAHRCDGCAFCEIPSERVVAENELAYAIRDGFPVTHHHTLIIPKRHVPDYFDLHQPELNAVQQLLQAERQTVRGLDRSVEGFNVGINPGEVSGQTIFHCHIHLIPRGGVRGVIPERRIY